MKSTLNNLNTTQQLASFVEQTEYNHLPEDVISKAKDAILDTIGVTLAGVNTQAGKIILRYAKTLGGTEQASVLGGGFQTSSPLAALVNGTFSHSYDYDDDNWAMMGHPSAPILAAILAIGEEKGVAGKALLTAYAVGYEVEAKLGKGMNPAHYGLGWHPTSTLGIMGATAATAKLLQLSSKQIALALGIAASQASGLRQNFGTMTKPLHVGHAAMAGVQAAVLAQMGLTANDSILEAPLGFAKLYTQDDDFQLEAITNSLGKPYEIIASGSFIKKYPCCAFSHRAIDALLDLVNTYGFSAQAVAEIECVIGPLTDEVLKYSRPINGTEAKFSLEYCLATALLDKKLGLAQFTDDSVQRDEIQQLYPRIQRRIYADIPKDSTIEKDLPSIIKVTLNDGQPFSQEVVLQKGHPQNPLSQAELHAKFWECASLALSPERIEHAFSQLLQLDKVEHINPLMSILRG